MRASGWLSAIAYIVHAASAAGLDVIVDDAHGAPVADAVVTAALAGGGAVALPAATVPATHIIDQKDETFVPYIEVFRPGDKVVFHNSDRTRHHVYSFAPARQFEFVLAPGESSPPLQLDRPGVIAVGCNIHDRMITYFFVTDAPFVARTDGHGHAHVDFPAGRFEVRVWHPRQRPGRPVLEQVVTTDTPQQPLTFSLALLPDPRGAPDRERASY